MSKRETAQTISDRAAKWVVRLDRDGDDAAVRAELDAWLAGDDRRRGAFFRAEAAWNMLDRASVLGAGQGPQREAVDTRGAWFSRRLLLRGGGAVAAAMIVGVVSVKLFTGPDQTIQTATGEIRRIPLSDGSFTAVNTQTTLDVAMKSDVRQVALREGEAWFRVAKDRSRPFIVEAGDVRVKAVGTAFAVRRTGDRVDVHVTEGVVEVWRVGDEANAQRAAAGTRALVVEGKAVALATAISGETDRTLAWRTGQLVFDGDTVAEAVAEFNRYNIRKLEVTDSTLAGQKMIGRFRTDEPDAFAQAVAALMNARADIRSDRILLSAQ